MTQCSISGKFWTRPEEMC